MAKSAQALIEWTNTDREPDEARDVPDVTVYADGRVRFGPRLCGGGPVWHTLSPDDLAALRRFVFEDQAIAGVEGETLAKEVAEATARQQKARTSDSAILSVTPQRDAGTTILRTADAGRVCEVRYYDLFGDAQRYPEVDALRRLRLVELRVLQVYEAYASSR